MKTSYPAKQNRSYAQIEAEAQVVRRTLGFDLAGRIPGIRLFEMLEGFQNRGLRLSYAVNRLQPGVEAEAHVDRNRNEIIICLTPETYAALERESPRARFSLFHELGHAVLHRQELIQLSEVSRREVRALHRGASKSLPPYRDVEWQANAFAAAIAMPARGLRRLELAGHLDAASIREEFGTSLQSSQIRRKVYLKRRADLLT